MFYCSFNSFRPEKWPTVCKHHLLMSFLSTIFHIIIQSSLNFVLNGLFHCKSDWFWWVLGIKQATNNKLKQWWPSSLMDICITRSQFIDTRQQFVACSALSYDLHTLWFISGREPCRISFSGNSPQITFGYHHNKVWYKNVLHVVLQQK